MDANMGKAMGLNQSEQRIACLADEGHACAEDCGGTGGWEYLKDEFRKARAGDRELREWCKKSCYNGEGKGLDPYKWDLLDINAKLGEVRWLSSSWRPVLGLLTCVQIEV